MTEDEMPQKQEKGEEYTFMAEKKRTREEEKPTCVPELGHKIYVLRVDHVHKSLKAPELKTEDLSLRKETDISVSIFLKPDIKLHVSCFAGILVTYYRVRIPISMVNILTSLGVSKLCSNHGYLNALSCPQWTTVNSPVSVPLSSWKGHAVWRV